MCLVGWLVGGWVRRIGLLLISMVKWVALVGWFGWLVMVVGWLVGRFFVSTASWLHWFVG